MRYVNHILEVLYIKRFLSQVRKAIQDFDMIQEGDRIAVGVSGGKDSLTLLLALKNLMDFYPKRFEIEAVTINMGLGEFDLSPVKSLCEDIGVNYTIEDTLIGRIVFEAREEKNPCSLCANLRRGALNNVAKRPNCNKVALAHNRDDVIETLLMSTFYEGRIYSAESLQSKRKDKETIFQTAAARYVEGQQGSKKQPLRRHIEKRPGRLAQMN